MPTDAPRVQRDNPSALPPGTRLGEFELLSLLGVGGFGIVYLAFDHALEREVAVKEYMPASLAGRTETMHVSLRSQSDADTFALGLRSFVNEAKLLARFDHPSLLKVHRFWEANGTAYMAMPVMRGRTVKDVRAAMSAPPDEAWLREMLTPLLGAIEKLHSEGVYHRDIAPDNIQIEPGGHPVLLDFGAARRVISDKSQTLTAILKPAYAPIEQYAEAGSVKQGPWTDLYALGATLHYLLLHRPPPPATTRAVHDEASSLTVDACPDCSENFLRTIDWMLAPRPIDRPQSVAALREVLEGRAGPRLRRAAAAAPASDWDRTVVLPHRTPAPIDLDVDDEATRVLPQPARAAAAPPQQAAVAAPAPAPAAAPTPPPPVALPEFSAPPVSSLSVAHPIAARSSWRPVAAGLGAVAAAAAAFLLWPRPSAAPPTPSAAAQPAPSAAALPAPAVADSPAPVASAVPESVVTTVVVPPVATRADKAPAVASGKPPDKPAPRPAPGDKPAGTHNGPATAPTNAMPSPTQPPSERIQQQTDRPTQAAAPAPPVAAASTPAKPAVAAGPEATCSGRNPISYFICMERECLRSELASHPDCLKWRKEAKRE